MEGIESENPATPDAHNSIAESKRQKWLFKEETLGDLWEQLEHARLLVGTGSDIAKWECQQAEAAIFVAQAWIARAAKEVNAAIVNLER